MRFRHALWVTLLAAGIGAGILGWSYAVRFADTREARVLLSRCSAFPDQETATRMAELLARRNLDSHLGNEILRVLATPEIITRAAYADNAPIPIVIVREHEARFPGMHLDCRDKMFIDGEPRSGGRNRGDDRLPSMNSVAWSGAPEHFARNEDNALHVVTYHYACQLLPESGERPYYETELTVTANFRVVSESDAEQVVLVSSASLDQRIHAGLESRIAPTYTYSGSPTANSYVEQRGCSVLTIRNLPENVAWRVSFRDEQGVIDPDARFGDVVGRAGPMFNAAFPQPIDSETTGHFRGSLILTPDPAAAYSDPRIKTIWNKTIEVPADFTIKAGIPPWERDSAPPVDPDAKSSGT